MSEEAKTEPGNNLQFGEGSKLYQCPHCGQWNESICVYNGTLYINCDCVPENEKYIYKSKDSKFMSDEKAEKRSVEWTDKTVRAIIIDIPLENVILNRILLTTGKQGYLAGWKACEKYLQEKKELSPEGHEQEWLQHLKRINNCE